ncbi:MAG: hypothetical protein LAT82_03970 [Nanoarchaeota archaeon]|nr:hypothetical protein [Nanoarchaeota archaeon]
MINGVGGKFLDKFSLKEKYNRVQAPFMQTQRGDNVVYAYRQSLEQELGIEIPLESELLYDKFILDVIQRSAQNSRVFSRELDTSGRFVNFNGSQRMPNENDFELFKEYLEIVRENSSQNKVISPNKNYPQLSLDMLNLVVFISQLQEVGAEEEDTNAYFLGGSISNDYMPRSFRSMEKLYRNKLFPKNLQFLPQNPQLTLLDVSVGRIGEENTYK